ncbi:MAG: hypothetical protein ACI9WC_002634 [Arenicella sp.]|jgi:hypothetical protein
MSELSYINAKLDSTIASAALKNVLLENFHPHM